MRYCLIMLALFAGSVFAAPGHWYEPNRSGHGLQIDEATSGGHAVIWYLYTPSGEPTFLAGEPCQSFPCVTVLYSPTARYMGGDPELGPPVGELEIGTAEGETLRIRYDVRSWVFPRCEGSTPGGVLLDECAGNKMLRLLAP